MKFKILGSVYEVWRIVNIIWESICGLVFMLFQFSFLEKLFFYIFRYSMGKNKVKKWQVLRQENEFVVSLKENFCFKIIIKMNC